MQAAASLFNSDVDWNRISGDPGPGTAAMHVRCPHCRNAIEIVGADQLSDVVCPSCGSSFNLVAETDSYVAAVRTIAHFELLEALGSGGFGTVYKAKDTQLERLVAVKIPRRDQIDPAQMEMFLREARAAAQLQHSGIVAVHEVGRENGTLYIVSDYIRGVTLADRLTSGPMAAREAAHCLAAVADALHHAHERGVIHRDLKPSNIMLEQRDANESNSAAPAYAPKLLDFGLAKREAGEITMTIDGKVLGTAAYMSPEQARGEAHHVDRRSDVYSLGVILFELLTGERPFRGNRAMLLHQVIHDEPPSPRRLAARVPRDLETICLRCLHKDRRRRYGAAADVAAELRRWLAGQPILARPISTSERVWSWVRRKPLVAALIAACAFSLLAGGIGSSYFAVREHARATQEEIQRKRADGETSRAKSASSLAALEARRAKSESQRAYRNFYLAQMNLAQRDWEVANIPSVLKRLERTTPQLTGGLDLRGLEWHYLDRQCHREAAILQGSFQQEVMDIAVHPNGQRIACAAGTGIHIWDLLSNAKVMSIWDRAEFVCLAYSPDGSTLAAGGSTLKLWSAESGAELRSLAGTLTSAVKSLAFNGDGTLLAAGCDEGELRIFDPHSAKQLFMVRGHRGTVEGVAFHPDGNRLATGSADNEAKVWNAATGELIHTLQGHHEAIKDVAFSPDGIRLATASADHTVKLWSTSSGNEFITFRGHQGQVTSVEFDPRDTEGQRLASASWDKTVRVWDMRRRSEIDCFRGHTHFVWKVAYSLDGSQIVSGSWDRSCRVWNVDSDQRIGSAYPDARGGSLIVAVGANQQVAIAVAGRSDVALYERWSGHLVRRLAAHQDHIRGLAMQPAGSLMATACQDGKTRLWSVESGNLERTFDVHYAAASCVSFSGDGRQLLSGGDNGTAMLIDLKSERQPIALIGHKSQVFGGSFDRAAKRVVTGSRDQTAKVWDATTGAELFTIGGQIGAIYHASFSPDDRWIATASGDKTVRIWRASDGQELYVLRGHHDPVSQVVFDEACTRIATVDHRELRIWEASSGEELLALRYSHAPILHLAFNRLGNAIEYVGEGSAGPLSGTLDGSPR